MPLVKGAKLGVNPYKVSSNVITQRCAAYLQSLLLTLPIIEILSSLSGFETDFQRYKWQERRLFAFGTRDISHITPRVRGIVYEKRNCS